MTPQEVLLKAIDILHERGWVRGQFSSPEGVCIARAISLAGSGETTWEVRDLVWHEIDERTGAHYLLTDWNDFHARDVDEVIDVLKRAAERDVH